MTAVPSRLGLASRKAGSDTAALKRKEVIGSGFKGKQDMNEERKPEEEIDVFCKVGGCLALVHKRTT